MMRLPNLTRRNALIATHDALATVLAVLTSFYLRFESDLVGRSHECDFPPSVKHLPALTEPKFNPEGSSAEIDARATRDGWPALHAQLARVDPATAARLQPTDAQRIQRALEVFHLSGTPLSALQDARQSDDAPDLVAIALVPSDRAELHRRIADRFDAMLAVGLIEEVRMLRRHFSLTGSMPSMRCVGYRQVWDVLEGAQTPGDLRERGIAATRQLAKRQLTWLRSMQAQTLDCFAPKLPRQIAELVDAHASRVRS